MCLVVSPSIPVDAGHCGCSGSCWRHHIVCLWGGDFWLVFFEISLHGSSRSKHCGRLRLFPAIHLTGQTDMGW